MRLVALLLLAGALFAQSDRGTVTGTIADPAGAVVPNAPVQARNTQTGALYEAATSATGNYTIAQLPVGSYELNVTVPGFKKYTRQGLDVGVAQTLRIDIALEVGAATESVTVTEAAPLLKTESGELSHNVASQRLNELPVLGIGGGQAGSSGIRNPNAVLQLIPGTYYTANSEVRINGAPDNTQAYRIEGMDASAGGTPGVPAQQQPSVDAIQEVAVQTSNYAAEFGQAGGGVFNVTMKSGTNQFHGSAYDYFVNEALNAGNPFTQNTAGGKPNELIRPRQRRNDYGFTFGGPVWIPKIYDGHDKTFFFFNWEQFREKSQVSTISQTVPVQAFRDGDFSQLLTRGRNLAANDPLGNALIEGMIFDPATTRTVTCTVAVTNCALGASAVVRDPFPGNRIPVGRFDPVSAKIQQLVPLPTSPNALLLNYLPSFASSRVTTIPAFKIDHQISSKAKLSFYWSKTGTVSPISAGLGQADGLPDPISTSIGTFTFSHIYRLNYDHTLTPTMLLHLGAGYQDVDQGVPSVLADGSRTNYDAVKELGLRGATVNRFFPSIQNALNASFGGLKNIGSGSDTHNYTQKPTFNASLTMVKGNHTYKFGGEQRIEGYPAQNYGSVNGVYGFGVTQTSQPYLQNTLIGGLSPGFQYASFLLGQVNNGSLGNPVNPKLGKNQLGLFAQDTWKVTRKFTLDYGLRYDYSTYLSERFGRVPFFSPTTPNPALGGRLGAVIFEGDGPGQCNCKVAKNYPWAFGPRLGAAYQMNAKTVFRMGFGIVYNGTATNNNSGGGLASSVSNYTATPGTAIFQLSNGIPDNLKPLPWPNLNSGQFPVNPAGPPANLPAPRADQNAGRPARQYQWSFGVQRELTRDLAVEASYVGNRGVWWISNALLNLNAIEPSTLASRGIDIRNPADVALLNQPLTNATVVARGLGVRPYPTFPLTQTLGQSLRPFPQFLNINSYWAPMGKTWYDSLQMKATKRLSHGLNATAIFVWSRSFAMGAERDPNPGTSGNVVTNDVFNRNLNKYLSLHDQPFVFNTSISYRTPRINTNRYLSQALRDWTVGAFLQYASGLPLQVPVAQHNLNTQLFQTTFANRVPGQPLFLRDLNCHCFDPGKELVLNPNAWVDPAPGQFSSSTAYYTDFRKQRRPSESMNFGRTFVVKEGVELQLRAEFSNVFNRAIVNNPVTTNAKQLAGTGAFGFIDRTTQQGGAGVAALVNISPRNGTIVARIRF